MTNPAAFKATLVDFKNIRTRKLVQIIFEAPIEDANSILECLGGYGELGKESWWAVARLMPHNKPASEPVKPEYDLAVTTGTKPRRRWDELSYAEQAGIRCGEVSFQSFCRQYVGRTLKAPEAVRYWCRVDSRADLKRGTAHGKSWEELETKYQTWLKAAEHA